MTPLVAALPMYDWPEVRAETDRRWTSLQERLHAEHIPAPARLARRNADLPPVPGGIRDGAGRIIAPDPATLPPDEFHLPTLWRHPALLLAQTCWGPMEEGLAAEVAVVGQGSYSGIEGGEDERYSSAILMRAGVETGPVATREPTSPLACAPGIPQLPNGSRRTGSAEAAAAPIAAALIDRLRGKRFAYNGADSLSGLLALQRDLEDAGGSLSIFSALLSTGAHRASIVAVAEGRADACTVDCRTWALAQRFEPQAAALSVVGWTAKRLGLPFVTARNTNPGVQGVLRDALNGFTV